MSKTLNARIPNKITSRLSGGSTFFNEYFHLSFRLAYKLTHLYYNWPGTVRVPAPCQVGIIVLSFSYDLFVKTCFTLNAKIVDCTNMNAYFVKCIHITIF